MLAKFTLISKPIVTLITARLIVVGSKPIGGKEVFKIGRKSPKACPNKVPNNPPIINRITKIHGFFAPRAKIITPMLYSQLLSF